MVDTAFQALSAEDKRHALRVVQGLSGRRAHLLEKDVWVVQTLSVLFDAPFGADLVFKGGTSLAKGYQVLRRFSEDVDITYDIRAFAPDLAADAGEEALPPTRSQERRWSKAIRARLSTWVEEQAMPIIEDGLHRAGFAARFRADTVQRRRMGQGGTRWEAGVTFPTGFGHRQRALGARVCCIGPSPWNSPARSTSRCRRGMAT